MASGRMSLLSIMVIVIYGHIGTMEASKDIGVCYGMMGNNLPSPSDVVTLYKKYGIGKLRLFDPNHAALEALRGSQIDVSLGVLNQDIPIIASNQEAANSWFETNVAPYLNDVTINYISVGNEVIPGEYAGSIVPAMQNLQKILDDKGLAGISITTVVSGQTLANSYPPSAATFSAEARETLVQVLKFLSAQANPLMINVYPYFAYASDPVNVRLDYAQFTASGPVVVDGSLSYQNLFDAIVDSFFWAMEKEGVTYVELVVSESGWPSAGNGELTTPELAATYNKNFMEHVMKNGTPKRPNSYIEGFIFAMFNENLKPDGVEQNFGLFYPTMDPIYPLFPKQ
ncbi:hypothetical protein RJ639_026779 [Escallonia herrerae]|uniref:Glucan endo-1,3-beta-D-glucosidase n=1 Tax=Escallonia herrerae TaxID=1293975 RepID=A0AA88X6H9_9ASTE|nr:hypothetical protein RJ639_026779 [Escallonia herrerae]